MVASFAAADKLHGGKEPGRDVYHCQASLTITADGKISPRAPLPTLTFTTTGLVDSDTLTTQPTLSTTATTSSRPRDVRNHDQRSRGFIKLYDYLM